MRNILQDTPPIIVSDDKYEPLLTDLQGNILSDHERVYSRQIIIQFKEAQIKAALSWIASLDLTSAADLLVEENNASEASRGRFCGFSLGVDGYGVLGFRDNIPFDDVFSVTMKKRDLANLGVPNATGDPAVSTWEAPYQESIHGLLTLANDDKTALEQETAETLKTLDSFCTILTVEKGFSKKSNGFTVEPFGYLDGISQPLFYQEQKTKYNKQEAMNTQWDPFAQLSLALFKDPNSDENAYGSFLVYRKLEQDVSGFNQAIAEMAQALNVSEELAGAMVVGRFKDGTPVLLKDSPEGGEPKNNFDYADDVQGAKCPFHSHIRKTNPRGDTHRLLPTPEDMAFERGHRMVRRAVPYGMDPEETSEQQGLLFMSYQSDIANQFIFQQGAWANQRDFVKPDVGSDTLVGQSSARDYEWPKQWGDASETIPFSLASYVSMKGGEYLFTPSISFLKNIQNI